MQPKVWFKRLRCISSFHQEANNIKSAKGLEVRVYYKSWMLYVQLKESTNMEKKKYVTSVQPQGEKALSGNEYFISFLISLSPQW